MTLTLTATATAFPTQFASASASAFAFALALAPAFAFAPALRYPPPRMRLVLPAFALALVAACSPVELPLVSATALTDTTDPAGPYPVEARVSARRSISRVELVWHNAAVGPGQAERALMAQDAQTGVYRALLPGLGRGATVAYHVEATDDQGDTGFWPPGSETGTRCGDEVCFQVLPQP